MTRINLLRQFGCLWQLSLGPTSKSYTHKTVSLAQQFVQETSDSPPFTTDVSDFGVCQEQNQTVTSHLLDSFKDPEAAIRNRALAGLCLRCYLSQIILKTCQSLARQFSSHRQFSLRDLLSFVLTDDGKSLVVLSKDGKFQLTLDSTNNTQKSTFDIFAVKILQTFNADLVAGMSLDSWAALQTRQSPDLKAFLSEYGFRALSDWALLNRVSKTQLTWLTPSDRLLIEAFHQIYRRDRCQQAQRGKCPVPTASQLEQMQMYLKKYNENSLSHQKLLSDLKRVAAQLRSYDVWNNRESLDDQNNQASGLAAIDNAIDSLKIEQQELSHFIHTQLDLALTQSIVQALRSQIETLRKSRAYKPFADQFVHGLRLYYEQGFTLREIVPKLGMTSWDQARRILNPGKLLTRVRSQVVSQLLEQMLNKAHQMGLTPQPPQQDYLTKLAEQVENFIDTEIFNRAAEELRIGQNRSLTSDYANRLRQVLRSDVLSRN